MILTVFNDDKQVGKTTIATQLAKSNECLYVTNDQENIFVISNNKDCILINPDTAIPAPSKADNIVFDLNGKYSHSLDSAITKADYVIIPTYSSADFTKLMETFIEVYRLNSNVMFIINKVSLSNKVKHNKDYLFQRRIATYLRIKRYPVEQIKIKILHERKELQDITMDNPTISPEFNQINRYFKQGETLGI